MFSSGQIKLRLLFVKNIQIRYSVQVLEEFKHFRDENPKVDRKYQNIWAKRPSKNEDEQQEQENQEEKLPGILSIKTNRLILFCLVVQYKLWG